MKYLLMLCFTFVITYSYAQPDIVWQKAYGGSYSDLMEDCKPTADGGYIFIGRTESRDGDVNPASNGTDVWVVKTTASGNIEWQKAYGNDSSEQGYAIVQANDGGYVFTGYRQQCVSAPGYHECFSSIILVKIDANGSVVWEKKYGGKEYDRPYDMCKASDGGYLLLGAKVSSSPAENSDTWVLKVDVNGNYEWEQTWGGSKGETGRVISNTYDGGYIIGSHSNSDDGDVGKSFGAGDIWITKIDNKGQLQWGNVFGGASVDWVTDIKETIDGGYIVVGGAITDQYYPAQLGYYDAYIMKLDKQGNKLWTKVSGGSDFDLFNAVYPKDDGNYIVCGSSQSTDGDIKDPKGRGDVWVAELYGDGTVMWSKNMGSSEDDFSLCMAVSKEGIVAGGIVQGGDKDATGSGYHGSSDFWVVKLESTLSIDTKQQEQEIKVYPTVTNGKVNISLGEQKDAEVYLLNMNGQILYKDNSHQSDRVVNLQTYASGAYFIKVVSSSFIKTCKVIYAR